MYMFRRHVFIHFNNQDTTSNQHNLIINPYLSWHQYLQVSVPYLTTIYMACRPKQLPYQKLEINNSGSSCIILFFVLTLKYKVLLDEKGTDYIRDISQIRSIMERFFQIYVALRLGRHHGRYVCMGRSLC